MYQKTPLRPPSTWRSKMWFPLCPPQPVFSRPSVSLSEAKHSDRHNHIHMNLSMHSKTNAGQKVFQTKLRCVTATLQFRCLKMWPLARFRLRTSLSPCPMHCFRTSCIDGLLLCILRFYLFYLSSSCPCPFLEDHSFSPVAHVEKLSKALR